MITIMLLVKRNHGDIDQGFSHQVKELAEGLQMEEAVGILITNLKRQ